MLPLIYEYWLNKFTACDELKKSQDRDQILRSLGSKRLWQIELFWLAVNVFLFLFGTAISFLLYSATKELHIIYRSLGWILIVAMLLIVSHFIYYSTENWRLIRRIRLANEPVEFENFLRYYDKRDFAVYLRAFKQEENHYLYQSEFENPMFLGPKFERILLKLCGSHLPIVGLVNPLLESPLSDIIRVDIGKRKWQSCIEEIIEKSSCIFLFVNKITDNIEFELSLSQKIASQKTIVFAPEYHYTPFYPRYHLQDFRSRIVEIISKQEYPPVFLSVPYWAWGGLADSNWIWLVLSIGFSAIIVIVAHSLSLFPENQSPWFWLFMLAVCIFFFVEIAYERLMFRIRLLKFKRRFKSALGSLYRTKALYKGVTH